MGDDLGLRRTSVLKGYRKVIRWLRVESEERRPRSLPWPHRIHASTISQDTRTRMQHTGDETTLEHRDVSSSSSRSHGRSPVAPPVMEVRAGRYGRSSGPEVQFADGPGGDGNAGKMSREMSMAAGECHLALTSTAM